MSSLHEYDKRLVEEFLLKTKKKGVYLNQDNEYTPSGFLNFTLDDEFYTVNQSELNPNVYSLYFYSQQSIEQLADNFNFDPTSANNLIKNLYERACRVFKIGFNYSNIEEIPSCLNDIIDSYNYDGEHYFFSLSIQTPIDNVEILVMFDILMDIESDIIYVSNRFYYQIKFDINNGSPSEVSSIKDLIEFKDFNSVMIYFCEQHVKKWDEYNSYYIKDHILKYLKESE